MNASAIEFNGKNINAHSIMGVNDTSIDAYGKQKVSLDYSLFSSTFAYTIDPMKWNHVSGDGVSLVDYTMEIDNSLISSRQHMKYQANRGMLFSCSAVCPNSSVGIRRWGLFNSECGVYFELNEGVLYAVIRNYLGGVTTETKEVITLKHPIDFEMGNLYDIQFQWRGFGNFRFFINLEEVHYIDYVGKHNKLSISNPSLPITLFAQNSKLYIGSVDVSTENGKKPTLKYSNIHNTADKLISTNTPMLSLRCKDTYKGRLNTTDLSMLQAVFSSDKKATFEIYFTRDLTAFTGAVWTDVDDTSYMMDTSATAFNITKGVKVAFTQLNVAGTQYIDTPAGVEFVCVAGDILVVVGTASNAYSRAQLIFGEE